MSYTKIQDNLHRRYSTAGDILPEGLYQWQAVAKLIKGDDDPYEGLGWTPLEAIKDLYKNLERLDNEIKILLLEE